MGKQKVLIINSYAGSLTIAAHQVGAEIIGSYEDCAFGIEAQKANYPKLKYVDNLPWPKQDLKGVHVIAHPPCAAFSVQNASNHAIHGKRQYMGTGTDAFKCHRTVMDYALSQNCESLAIESVMGAHEGAREVHDKIAIKYGYNCFRILQNAISFGVPQWRERFWVIFSKRKELPVLFDPVYKNISSIIRATGTPVKRDAGFSVALKHVNEIGITREKFIETYLSGDRTGNLFTIARDIHEIEDPGPNHINVRDALNMRGTFTSKMPYVLNPELWAPVLIADCSWFYLGRQLFEEEMKLIMGFPVEYKFPENMRGPIRTFLSKGVCPPVAKWILQVQFGMKSNKAIFPGETLDLRIKKKEVENKLRHRSMFAKP